MTTPYFANGHVIMKRYQIEKVLIGRYTCSRAPMQLAPRLTCPSGRPPSVLSVQPGQQVGYEDASMSVPVPRIRGPVRAAENQTS